MTTCVTAAYGIHIVTKTDRGMVLWEDTVVLFLEEMGRQESGFLRGKNFFLSPGISKNRTGWPPKQI